MEGEGRRLDRFELVAELATGGMATVFLARLSGVGGFQRFVAIKRLHPHLAREPEFIEMFVEEARLSARIHHPNVVPILEIGTSDEGYYIVMEYVEGDTLGRLLARSAQMGTRLPTKVGLRVMLDMLAGLDAAHELGDDDGNPLGIVHRDVSPQNVLVGIDGSSRLSDFGVARATSKLSTTRTGQLKGKLAYMAPEQAKGARDIDRRADIFASGVVLWEVLASRRLFKGESEADTLNRVLNEPIPPVRGVAPTVPAALEAVVAKALERDRSKRYASAAEFADALERASRVVGALGTHKDVAAHLDAVLGTEISQQREAVRSWLARSEPSRHGMNTPPSPSQDALPRVDRGEVSASGVSSFSRAKSAPASGRTPSTVSGVASGASAIPSSPPPEPASLPAPLPMATRRRGSALPWTIAVIGVLAAAAFGYRYFRQSTMVNAAGPTPQVPSIATAVGSSVPLPEVPTQAPSVPPPPALSVSAPGGDVASASPVRVHFGRTQPVPPRPVPPPPAAVTNAPPPSPAPTPAVPDDISRNPYR